LEALLLGINRHEFGFLFEFLNPKEDLTINDMLTLLKKGGGSLIDENGLGTFEMAVGKAFDEVERNICETHEQMKEIIEKA